MLTPDPGRAPARGIALRLFVTCWLLYAVHFATNTVREIYLALALGDHFSFDVSEYLGLHSDIFEIPGRGAFIDNNPGASLLGAVPYIPARGLIGWLSARVERRRHASGASDAGRYDTVFPKVQEFYREARARGLDVKFGLAAAVMQVFGMAPVSALAVVVMYSVLHSLTRSPVPALFLALLYGFATPVLLRTAQLNHNLLVGHAAFFAFVLLWRPWDDAQAPGRPHYLAAGLLSGWAVVCDYSGVLVVAVMGGYAWIRRRALPASARAADDMWRFIGGVAAGLALLCGYQWACFGNPFYPAQAYMPPAHFTELGYKGMAWPHADLLWATGFDRRFGLFTSAPLLLLALYPPAWGRKTRLVGATEAWCIAVFCVLFGLFEAANQYGRMQFITGVRHIVPVVPFLFLIVAGTLLRWPRWLAIGIGSAALWWSWCVAMYRDVRQDRDIVESVVQASRDGPRFPWLTTLERMGYVASGTWELPLLLLLAVALWLMWTAGGRAAGFSGRRSGWRGNFCAWLGALLLAMAWGMNGSALALSSLWWASSWFRVLLATSGLGLGLVGLRMAGWPPPPTSLRQPG